MSYVDPFSAASAVEWFNGKDFKGRLFLMEISADSMQSYIDVAYFFLLAEEAQMSQCFANLCCSLLLSRKLRSFQSRRKKV